MTYNGPPRIYLYVSIFLLSIPSITMPSTTGNELKQYFLPGWGISRNILFSHIHFFLGPYASVRPFSYQGREGYLVMTPGPPLTEVRELRQADSHPR